MPLELVGAREPLPAEEPVAYKRPLAGVPSQMRLEVRRFPVNLPTARDVTAVEPLSPEAGARRSQSLRLLTVRTVASGSSRVPPGR